MYCYFRVSKNKRWLNNECGKAAEYELEVYKLAPRQIWKDDVLIVSISFDVITAEYDNWMRSWSHHFHEYYLPRSIESVYQVSPLDGFVKLWRYVCLTLNHLFSYLNKSDGFFKAFRHASVGFAYFWLTDHRTSKRAICKTDSVVWCLIGQWKSTIAAKPLKTMFDNNVGKFWNPYKC